MSDLKEVAYGERYADDSGWKRRLCVQTYRDFGVSIEIGGDLTCTIEDLAWLVKVGEQALKALGQDVPE